MKRVRLAAVAALALVVIATCALTWVRLPHAPAQPYHSMLSVRVVVRVGNKTVVAADPITENWPALVAYIFMPSANGKDGVNVISTDNITCNHANYWVVGIKPAQIVLGNGTKPKTIPKTGRVYALGHEVAAVNISSISIATSNNYCNVSMTGSYTSIYNFTLTEVGLIIHVKLNNLAERSVLVFYYHLPKPVTIKAGATIAVTYTFQYEK